MNPNQHFPSPCLLLALLTPPHHFLKAAEKKNHHKLKTFHRRHSEGGFPFPSILGHKQSVFWPLQPYCRAARRQSGQCWPSCVCRTSQRHFHPSFYQETPCEKTRFTPKRHTEVLLSSWGHLPDWEWRGSCCTAERESLDPQEPSFRARGMLGPPAWPPGLEKHHLLFFTKIARSPKEMG